MDKIDKNLLKVPPKQRQKILLTARQVNAGDLKGLDIKKLRGQTDIFRVRVGNYRIILRIIGQENPVIIAIERRSEKTYKNYR